MSFSEIKGQERTLKILRKCLATDHLAQTFLFHGPEGVGKKKAAVALAKALNCREEEDDACNHCTSCRKIDQGIHPDVTLIHEEEGDIKIGTIRDVINGMVYRPLEARKRVVIIDEAEKCNLSASNAFLKTLEEPPVDTVIILISSTPDTLPQTVLSRCHRVSFGNIPEAVIKDILVHEKGLSEAEAEYAASLAEGSIGRAIGLSSSEVREIRDQILSELNAAGKDRCRIFDLAERFSRDEKLFYDALYWIQSFFRDALIMKTQADNSLIINKDLTSPILELSAGMTIEKMLNVLDLIQTIHKGQVRNLNKQLSLDNLGIAVASGRA